MKEYTIGDTVYCLPEKGELVLAQTEQISEFLDEIGAKKALVGNDDTNAFELMLKVGANASKLLAILLTPKGMKVKDKDLKKIEEDLKYSMDANQAQEIINDFFTIHGLGILTPNMG